MSDPNAIRQAWFSPDGAVALTTILAGAWGVVEWFRARGRKKQGELDTANLRLADAEQEKKDNKDAAEKAALAAQLSAEKAAQDKEIEVAKKSLSVMWERVDTLRDQQQKCWTRDDQEKYRMEMTNDLKGLREELRQDFKELRDHFDAAVKTIMGKGE